MRPLHYSINVMLDGLPASLDLALVGSEDLGDGIVARRYAPTAR